MLEGTGKASSAQGEGSAGAWGPSHCLYLFSYMFEIRETYGPFKNFFHSYIPAPITVSCPTPS